MQGGKRKMQNACHPTFFNARFAARSQRTQGKLTDFTDYERHDDWEIPPIRESDESWF